MLKTITLYFALFMSTALFADVIGLSAGVNYWNYDLEGSVRSPLVNDNQVPINFNDNNDVNLFVVFEHPVPFFPNIKLQQNNIKSSGLITVSEASFMGGEEIPVRGDFDFSHTDLTLYYEVLDNWVNLDLGISAKYFDGYQRFKYEAEINSQLDFDHLIPMLYIKGQFDLPLTGLSAAVTVQALSFDSNKVTDVDLALKYQFNFGLGMDVGYRTLDVDLKNTNAFKSDVNMKGFFLGGYFEF